MTNIKTLRTCKKGHRFYKSSDCRVCPVCEEERKWENELFSSLSAPPRRALENKGIGTLQELSQFSEKEILQLHGIGKSAIPKLVQLLKTEGLKFTEIRK
ncbi:hypothetical protein [Flavobacterium sp. WC2509]|uniref:hypothetical protein n=1 Tax=Flavobacterium sp. WC2509 TaxID=3461406 RepID=UPI004044D4B8